MGIDKETMPFIENVVEFQCWLDKMLEDAKKKLNMTDGTIAWILLREGTAYYFKTLGDVHGKPKKAPKT